LRKYHAPAAVTMNSAMIMVASETSLFLCGGFRVSLASVTDFAWATTPTWSE
jgi:hypothetical protein